MVIFCIMNDRFVLSSIYFIQYLISSINQSAIKLLFLCINGSFLFPFGKLSNDCSVFSDILFTDMYSQVLVSFLFPFRFHALASAFYFCFVFAIVLDSDGFVHGLKWIFCSLLFQETALFYWMQLAHWPVGDLSQILNFKSNFQALFNGW